MFMVIYIVEPSWSWYLTIVLFICSGRRAQDWWCRRFSLFLYNCYRRRAVFPDARPVYPRRIRTM